MKEGQVTLNPLNRMPITPEQKVSANQSIVLPLARTISSIPKATGTATEAIAESSCPMGKGELKTPAWEYPSPQQFYNALVRKGWETPEESVEMMVNIHNWLNEEAWQQVRTWEETHTGFVLIHSLQAVIKIIFL